MQMLSIHKDVLKREYAASPLGKVEKALRRVYDQLSLNNKQLPEEIAKQVYEIRDENEKWQMDYIERTQKEQREAVDVRLLEAMSKELELLQKNGY